MEPEEPGGVEQGLAPWLAEATHMDPEQVARELEEGQRRREFVVNELIEAGFTGGALLDGVMRLTGVPSGEARELIVAHPDGPHALG